MAALITDYLQKLPSAERPRNWVIAHSGGLDSQVLLHLAARYFDTSELRVVHVNHHLQADAEQWAEFSQAQAAALGLRFFRLDVYPQSDSEEAARDARYQAFAENLQQGECLLLAHHADDQAETLLFRFLRGSGVAGLCGMPRSRPLAGGGLLRPLLHCSREALEGAAAALGLSSIEDPSNHSLDYDRNFLRAEILPGLKQRWPRLLQRWQSNAELMQQNQLLLESYLQQDLDQCLRAPDQLCLAALKALPLVRQPELLRFWVAQFCGELLNGRQLTQIERDLILAREDANPCYQLKTCSIRRFQGALYLVLPIPQTMAQPGPLQLGTHEFADGCLTVAPADAGLKTLKDLRVVRRQGGERCRPHGRGGSVTVKKLLQESAVPPWRRDAWPLLYHDDELVAVVGICVCDGWWSEKSGFSLLWRPFSLSEKA